MADVAKALAQAIGIFGATYVESKKQQEDDELQSRIKRFYLSQAEKQEERARAAEQRSIEDQKRQEQVYNQALDAKKKERETIVAMMQQMGIAGTPEELAARADIDNLTREQRQRDEEATKRKEREMTSRNTRATSLIAEEVPQDIAWQIADLEANFDKGQDTPELRAKHAELMNRGGEVSAKAKAALLESIKTPEVSRIPDGMRAELSAALGGTPEGQAKLARFREIESMPDKDRTPEMMAEYDNILAALGQQTGGDTDSQIREVNFMMDEIAKAGGAVKDIATGEYGEPTDPAARAKWQMYNAQKQQLLGLAQQATQAPVAEQKQDEGAAVVKNLASQITKRTDGREAKKLFVTMPGREPVEFNADDANLGRLLLKSKDAKVEVADGPEQIKLQEEALSRQALSDSSILGLLFRGVGQIAQGGAAGGMGPGGVPGQYLTPSAPAGSYKPEPIDKQLSNASRSFNRWLLGE